jgi:hypothetical protein
MFSPECKNEIIQLKLEIYENITRVYEIKTVGVHLNFRRFLAGNSGVRKSTP